MTSLRKKLYAIIAFLMAVYVAVFVFMYFASRDQVGLFSYFGYKTDWDDVLPSSNGGHDYCPPWGSAGAKWIGDLYAAVPKVGTCKTHTRIGKAGDGGKNVCLDNIVAGSCVVYSLGSRLDFSFENDVVDKLNCEVHTFDCTVGSPSKCHTEYIFIRGVLVVRMRKKQYPRTLDTVVKLGSTIPWKP